MSYSFQVRGPNKAAAKQMVADKFDAEVVAAQPVHANDRSQVMANVDAVIDFLPDDGTKDVMVTVNGSLSWTGSAPSESFTGCSVSAGAFLMNRG